MDFAIQEGIEIIRAVLILGIVKAVSGNKAPQWHADPTMQQACNPAQVSVYFFMTWRNHLALLPCQTPYPIYSFERPVLSCFNMSCCGAQQHASLAYWDTTQPFIREIVQGRSKT